MIVIRILSTSLALVAAYYAVTYAWSSVAIADNTFGSSLSGEFAIHAAVWGVIAMVLAALTMLTTLNYSREN